MDIIKIYMIKDRERGQGVYCWCSPSESSSWGNIACLDYVNSDGSPADYIVVFNTPVVDLSKVPPETILYFKWEPDEFLFTQLMWRDVHPKSHKFETTETGLLIRWEINKTYDQLKSMDFPEKPRTLSWITSNQGDGTQLPNIQVLEGHVLRMNFMKKFMEKYPGLLHLYGRRLDRYGSMGEVSDKWYALRDYRYSFAFENSWQRGFWTEEICDVILAGCMPIYWGCPNLEDFLPKNSFIRVDLRKDDAVERAYEIVQSDFREQHLDELREAKRLILDKYNVWPRLHEIINKLHERKHG